MPSDLDLHGQWLTAIACIAPSTPLYLHRLNNSQSLQHQTSNGSHIHILQHFTLCSYRSKPISACVATVLTLISYLMTLFSTTAGFFNGSLQLLALHTSATFNHYNYLYTSKGSSLQHHNYYIHVHIYNSYSLFAFT